MKPNRNGRSTDRSEIPIVRWRQGDESRRHKDTVAVEEPLEIRVRGQSVAVVMRTPGDETELATGFLLSEGVIRTRHDVHEVAPCLQGDAGRDGNVWNVFLSPSVEFDVEALSRHIVANASCGLCGKISIDSVHRDFPPLQMGARFDSQSLAALPERFHQGQPLFRATGGLHAAAILDSNGSLLVMREDIGRHNAVDKAVGFAFLAGLLPLESHMLMVSGRASFEIMQKALAARIPLVAAVSAPSSLAVEFAQDSGQTLVGFLRDGRFNVYSHPERLRNL